ncbi:MAG: hypothetical protein LBD40_02465 [Puniceicoccales bacterium]|jgi:hypothetical protein|nr:hypothetical protein [Puniceicoccales bacterium]
MDIGKNIAVVSVALGFFSSAYKLEATSLAELQERFAAYGALFSGELEEQVRAFQQELAHCARVEERDPWNFLKTKMSSLYPFFEEYATGPIRIYFEKEVLREIPTMFTKSQWWTERSHTLLAHLEKMKNLAEAGDIPVSLREELQNLLQDATAFIQAIYDGNQRIYLEEKEALERQKARFDIEKYADNLPDDIKDIFIYLQNLERGILDPRMADQGEILEKQLQFAEWQRNHPLLPYLPNKVDRDQFFETTGRILAEAVEGL